MQRSYDFLNEDTVSATTFERNAMPWLLCVRKVKSFLYKRQTFHLINTSNPFYIHKLSSDNFSRITPAFSGSLNWTSHVSQHVGYACSQLFLLPRSSRPFSKFIITLRPLLTVSTTFCHGIMFFV